MPPKRRGRPTKKANKSKASAKRNVVPGVYQEMLAEAIPEQLEVPERPLKKRKTGLRGTVGIAGSSKQVEEQTQDEDDDIEFEDVLDRSDSGKDETTGEKQQTAYRDSDEESEEDDDIEWQGIDFDFLPQEDGPSGDFELNLSKPVIPQTRKPVSRRRLVTKAERATRVEIHRMHILCLLASIYRRNNWCNNLDVQRSLKSLLSQKILKDLRPKSDLSQFGRTEFLKRGLEQTAKIWKTNFHITARGMQRSLWAEDEGDLQTYQLPDDAESPIEKDDFIAAAKSLKGSRDLGAQLYCALLRSAGVDARLICSLQPLPFNAGGPTRPKSSFIKAKSPPLEVKEQGTISSTPSRNNGTSAPGMASSVRQRLGHPNAADYYMPEIIAPPRPSPKPKPKPIQESPYPVFWVEVLDEAHQKWFPVDPLVTDTIAKPRAFEPPMSDRENCMSYVIAFDDGGHARDVTKRYAKAYNAKTRKNRIESTQGGAKWWRKTLRPFTEDCKSDLDQIEDAELLATEAKEPMPKNIADFKDHPVYALERHLKRNEILVATRDIGKVAAGRDSNTLGGKKMESVYRRRDVRVVKSADAWYRIGRDVKMGEQPVKTVPAKRRPDEGDLGDIIDERPGTNLYTEDQTEIFKAPPVVNGRIPKNSFGNIDIFVPSMVPKGGTHLPYDEAARASRILGIDYADALTGFEFRGKHGTAVLKGVVVAAEFREAVEAVIDGLADERAWEYEERRTTAILNKWKRFLVGLRIKDRVDSYAVDGEEEPEAIENAYEEEDTDENYIEDGHDYDDDGGGGFLLE